MRNQLRIIRILTALAISATLAGPAFATTVNLTSAGSSGSIGNAYFKQVSNQTTGTGVINPFVRLQNNGTEKGFNSDSPLVGSGDLADVKKGTWTHSLFVNEFGIVNNPDLSNTPSLRFLLDINQTSANPLLSLNELKIFVADTPDLSTEASLFSKTLIYDMGNNKVLMDYSLNPGSGAGDVMMWLPASLFAGKENKYLYLYSKFGASQGYATNDGFEEWAKIDQAAPVPGVPEPKSMLLLGVGLLGLVALRRKN